MWPKLTFELTKTVTHQKVGNLSKFWHENIFLTQIFTKPAFKTDAQKHGAVPAQLQVGCFSDVAQEL